MALIIVESPTKARTFNRYLKGEKYFVFATMGHIRDLPENELAIDYQNNFAPKYELVKNKKKIVDALIKLAQENDEIILATDLDREGESISYHVAYLLGFIEEKWPDFNLKNNGKKVKRIIFHEITLNALKEALNNPSSIRENLVKAQQARRILDRIVGYELSPLLWKKIGKRWLSAGRVQTVALRLIVEREKEIKNFKVEEFYEIDAFFKKNGEENDNTLIRAKLIGQNDFSYDQKITIKLFASDYTYTKSILDDNLVKRIKADLNQDSFQVVDFQESIEHRYPPPPFTTSLLQQEAFQRYNFSSRLTMKIAQDLYESGLITYHRTDSFHLSPAFVFKVRDYIKKEFGEKYLFDKPRSFKGKSRLAQEAHEAIRPTQLKKEIKHKSINHQRLYNLIFDRTISFQMKEAEIKVVRIFIDSKKNYHFVAEDKTLIFDGFLRVLNPKYTEESHNHLSIKIGDQLELVKIEEKKNFTRPPLRYNEATLIKTLEERGIGRPSTYAAIISLIQDKHYVEKINRYFVPSKLGETICDYLSSSFPNLFGLNFTAAMEEGLDEIAEGKKPMLQLLQNFYQPFIKELQAKKNDETVINVEEEINEKCPNCQSNLVVRYSKYGKFLACANYPKCKFTKSFLNYVEGKTCPSCGGRIVIKYTKTKKRFYGCENYPKCQWRAWKIITR